VHRRASRHLQFSFFAIASAAIAAKPFSTLDNTGCSNGGARLNVATRLDQRLQRRATSPHNQAHIARIAEKERDHGGVEN